MGAERRNSDVGRSRVSKSVREGFPKEVIPILCLKWQTVVIQTENPGKAYPGENLLEELQNLTRPVPMRWGLDPEESIM